MNGRKFVRSAACAGASLAALFSADLLKAQDVAAASAGEGSALEEVIVTAQKREQNLQDVGRSIAVLSSDDLAKQGVRSVAELATSVPALTVTTTEWGAPVLTLRGAGFYENSIAGSPAVSLYVDEVPITFAAESRGTLFDLERIEVLKGPQGTLFGQNSTGGAINFIAAKPTEKFVAGTDLSYGRFGAFDGSAYVGGRINDVMKARLAVQTQQGGAWQVSRTRADELGSRDLTSARLQLEFDGGGPLTANLTLSGWLDYSDVPTGQYILYRPRFPGPSLPDPSYPTASENARDADWDAGVDLTRHDRRGQASLRLDYEVTDEATITSITASSRYKYRFNQDQDGTPFENGFNNQRGNTRAFFQELRANGAFGPAVVTIGANYEESRAYEDLVQSFSEGTPRLALGDAFPSPSIEWNDRHDIQSKSIFANVEVDVGSGVTLKGGGRYTDFERDYSYCLVAGTFAPGFTATRDFLRSLFGVAAGAPIQPTDCTSLGPPPTFDTGPRNDRVLEEDNVSWQAGAQYEPMDELMVYANISKGYKSGTYPFGLSVFQASLAPVEQESLLAYETGFKFTPSRSFSLNAAGFYYDYKNKQIKGIASDRTFGPLVVLISIPKSRIVGGEVEARWSPVEGLDVRGSATYVDAKVVGDFLNADTFSNDLNFRGMRLPLTPRFSGDLDVEYGYPIGNLEVYVGGHLNYQSSTDALISDPTDPRSRLLHLPSRPVFDARLGVTFGSYTVELWARNVFDKFYATNVYSGADTINRIPGMPATYGIRMAAKY